MSGPITWYLGTAQLVAPYGLTNARRAAPGGSPPASGTTEPAAPGGDPPEPDVAAPAFRLLEAAVTAGVAGFDTARKYGGAEAVLGEFARAHGVNLPVVTKILDTPAGDLSDSAFADTALTAIDAAQERLAPLTLQAVLFHDPETACSRPDAVRTLVERARRAVPDIAIGNSVYEERQVHQDAWGGGAPVYQIPGNALDRRLLGRGWTPAQQIMVRSVFLQGLLVNREIALPPAIAGYAPILARYHRIVAQYALDPVATAIAAVNRQRPASPLVIGAELDTQVREIAASVAAAGDIPAEALDAIVELSAEVPPELIDPRRW